MSLSKKRKDQRKDRRSTPEYKGRKADRLAKINELYENKKLQKDKRLNEQTQRVESRQKTKSLVWNPALWD